MYILCIKFSPMVNGEQMVSKMVFKKCFLVFVGVLMVVVYLFKKKEGLRWCKFLRRASEDVVSREEQKVQTYESVLKCSCKRNL